MICRVLIVDDHLHALQAIRLLLQDEPRFIIAGSARSGEEALQMVTEQSYDLVLMDIQMTGLNGLQTTRLMKRSFPALKIIVVSVSDDSQDLYAALQAGAQGYLIKNIETSSWLGYLRAIAFEEGEIPEDVSRQMLQTFQSAIRSESVEWEKTLDFTQREMDILEEVGRGLTNRDISTQLFISEHTVKNHLKSMMQKANVDNRVKLAALALKMTRKSHGN